MRKPAGSKRYLLTIAGAALAVPFVLGALAAPRLRIQAPAAQSPAVPQWQIDAGGTMAFDVASVKRNTSGYPPTGQAPHSNFPLDQGTSYSANGGLFLATNWPLRVYVSFAYELTPGQSQAVQSNLPKWATTDHFDIEARAQGEPTKDQMRLMMQSLLADRFHLVAHFERRQEPVYGMVANNASKPGPGLQPHGDDPSCQETVAGTIPCGTMQARLATGQIHITGRAMTMELLASYLGAGGIGNIERPVLDQTGLAGTFDLSMEYAPTSMGHSPRISNRTRRHRLFSRR